LAYRGSWVSVWVSEIADTPLAVRIRRGRASGDFRREISPQLGPGFFPLEGSGESRSVWASGPSASVQVPQAAAGPATVTLSVHAARPAQRMVVLANGKPVATADTPQSSAPVTVTFAAHAGNNQLDLAFDSWNGVPDLFAPEDSRPLGMMIRQLSIETGDGWYELVSERATPPEVPLLHPGSIVDMGEEKRPGLLARGWASHANGSLRAALEGEAELRFRLSDSSSLEIEVSGFTERERPVDLLLNAYEITTWQFTPNLSTYRAALKSDALARDNRLVFRAWNAGGGSFARPSWLVLQTIRIARHGI
jgi:hypothetical protein